MSSDCKKIERELNSILRDMACAKNDTLAAANSFPHTARYETDFPPINSSSHRYNRKQDSHLTQVPNQLSHSFQDRKVQKTNRRYNNNKRFDGENSFRQQYDSSEHSVTKRKDQVMKHRPQKESKRNVFFRRQEVQDRKVNENQPEFDCSNLQSLSTMGTKMKDKDIKVLTAEDLQPERNISVDSNKKFKNFMHSNRRKRSDHPKSMDAKKIQANIFLSALTEASSVGESKKEKTKKVNIDDKVIFESEGTACAFKDEIPAVPQCDTEVPQCNVNNTHEARTATDNWIISNNSDQASTMTKVSLSKSSKDEKDECLPSNTDEFIRRCNKPSCNCSEDSLYCTLCDFHMSNPRELEKHRKQLIHDVRKKDYFRVKYLEALSVPSDSKLAAIEHLLSRTFTNHAHAAEDDNLRGQVIQELRDDLQTEIEEDCKFHLFGSSVNGFGHRDSNINIDLEVPQGLSPSKMLLRTLDALKDREIKYGNIVSDFSATFPSISFIDRRTKLPCEITLNNDASRKTSFLLKQYAEFDDRVQKLGVTFRVWAKICGIDQQEFCSLPAHCFPIMVIYFLQQTEPPVLPVFHDMVANEDDLITTDMKSLWKSRNRQTLAELWIDLFRFYAVTFKYKVHVISIRQRNPLLCKDKKWTTRMMCIEDPYSMKRNLARTIANPHWFQYIIECIRCSFEYFCTCRLSKGSNIPVIENSSNDEEDESSLSVEDNSIDSFFEDQDNELDVQSVVTAIKAMDIGNMTTETCQKDRNRAVFEECNSTECIKTKHALMEKKHCSNETMNLQTVESGCDTKDSFVYKFERSHFINAKPPVLFCRQCQKLNHVKKNCTIDDKLPELKKLPKMDKSHKEMLSEVCERVYHFCRPTIESTQENEILLYDLQRHIQFIFKDAMLELFGSSCNGFGFEDSDLDICLTFHNKSGEDLDQKSIIEQLTKELGRYKKIQNIIPIPTAKVPIIKFSFSGRKEGDISLYNTLGQHNTRLLSTYCKIDKRVQMLGYSLKFFAKKCDICDASRGSLSSYAYILMTIFYLQQLEVPVIPVLQELYDKNETMPERYVDNCNTWFFEDIDNLPNMWQDYGKNKQSLGELWMGLLIFYTEKFKMAEYVISIRQKAPLTRFEKLWNTRSIAIEDPFDHSHNLGAGVSRNMNAFILSAFRRGREQFGRIPPARRDIPDLLEHFFNNKVLTGGEKPPNERGCRHCLKIGHKMKECPLRRDNFRKRNNFERRGNNKANKQLGNFENRNSFTDRYRDDRRAYDTRGGAFRTNWNFHNSRDQNDARRKITNSNADIQSS